MSIPLPNEPLTRRARARSVAVIATVAFVFACPKAQAKPQRNVVAARPAAPPGQRSSAPVLEARRLFERGERLFAEGRFELALRAYQRGYELSGLPGFLLNIADCQLRLGRAAGARAAYEDYLRARPVGERAAVVRRALAALEAPTEAAHELRAPTTEADTEGARAIPRPVRLQAAPVEIVPTPMSSRRRGADQPVAWTRVQERPPAPASSGRGWWWLAVATAALAGAAYLTFRPQAPPEGTIGTLR